MTLEPIAIAYLNQAFAGQVYTGSFRAELLRAARLSGVQVPADCTMRPDAFLKLYLDGRVCLIAVEVEDTHPVPREKLEAYARLWWEFDCSTRHSLALVTTDRYGRPKPVDLCWMWYAVQGYPTAVVVTPEAEALGRIVRAAARHRRRTACGYYRERNRMNARRGRTNRRIALEV